MIHTIKLTNEVKFLLAPLKKNKHERFNYILVEEDKLYATDGHRLHIVNLDCLTETLETGLYQVISQDKRVVVLESIDRLSVNYPDVKRVIPTELPNEKTINTRKEEEFIASCMAPTGIAFNYIFLKDLYALTGEWKIKYDSSYKGGVLFEALNLKVSAVVMPMELKNIN
jgi:hypothetical protein